MTNQKRIAVVTGSNRGLGYAISRQLSQIGNRVILTSRNETDGLAANVVRLEVGKAGYPLVRE